MIITNCSCSKVQYQEPSNDTAIISILDSKNETHLTKRWPHELKIKFDLVRDGEDAGDRLPFDRNMAKAIIEFVLLLPSNIEQILVQESDGGSRAYSVAAALCDYVYEINDKNKKKVNWLIYDTLKEAYFYPNREIETTIFL